MINEVLEKKNHALYAELVPDEGAAYKVAGELLRAVNKIGYRFWNDGDQIGIGYGKQTCNAAARYILEEFGGTEMAKVVESIWGLYNEKLYESGVEMLVEAAVNYIDEHPELREEENKYDMLDYTEPEDDEEDEEDDEVYEGPWAVYDPD